MPTPMSDAAAVSNSDSVLPPRRSTRLTSKSSDAGINLFQLNNQSDSSAVLAGAPTTPRKLHKYGRNKCRANGHSQVNGPPPGRRKPGTEAQGRIVYDGGQQGEEGFPQLGTNENSFRTSPTSFCPNLSSLRQAEKPTAYSASSRDDGSTTPPIASCTARGHRGSGGKISNP